jgi:hypothetical protein
MKQTIFCRFLRRFSAYSTACGGGDAFELLMRFEPTLFQHGHFRCNVGELPAGVGDR